MSSSPPPSDEREQELKVFIVGRDSKCEACGEELAPGRMILLAGEKGALCLPCADLDELHFLPAGNMALTRRAKKHSVLSAVVLKWSRSRKRYERQGLLVQEAALLQAEKECLADADLRERQRERAAGRRAELEDGYVQQFAARIRALYPGAPPGREMDIALHACRVSSGRVGRTAAAHGFEAGVIHLAVRAHIRHAETDYDELLARGLPREDARAHVSAQVSQVMADWQRK